MAGGRIHTVVIAGVASPAAAFDFFEINAAAGKPCRLLRLVIAQTSEPTTEEEQLALTIHREDSTSGSGGSATTPRPVTQGDTAAGFTCETMNTTVATGGTPITLVETAWNTRAGIDLAFDPEREPPAVIGGGRLVVTSGAPADAVTIRGTAWIEELVG